MEYATIAGNYYTITSKSGCSVTDATGTLEETVEAGKQLAVQAPSDKLIIDDEQAIVFKANFNFALARISGGGKATLPLGYQQARFLESTGEQFIDTELVGRDSDSFVRFSGIANDVNRRAFQGNGFGATSIRSGRGDFYVLFPLKNGVQQRSGYLYDPRTTPYKLDIKISPERIDFKGETFAVSQLHELTQPSNITDRTLKLGAYADGENYQNTWWKGTCERFSARMANGEVDFVPALSPEGHPCMVDKKSGKVFKNKGAGKDFILGMNLSLARTLGMTLPDGGGDLHISLPAGWDKDAKTYASLSRAAERLWNIEVNPTTALASTASTYALRRVWVRRQQRETGNYVAADGSRWGIDWCEEVFSSSTPEELGYERFRSVDAAAEYWGLVPYVDPEMAEDELSNIEA